MAHVSPDSVSKLFIRGLRKDVTGMFHCSHVALNDAMAAKDYAGIIRFYEKQVEAARAALLYPDQAPEQSTGLDECYRAPGSHLLIQYWTRLISDIAHVAASIRQSLNELGHARDRFSRTIRRRLASQAVLAMRLMLLAQLYKERTDNNLIAKRLSRETMPSERAIIPRTRWRRTRTRLAKAIALYDRQLRAWHVRRALPAGWKDSGDTHAYDQWSQWFRAPIPGEEGWSGFPRLVGRDLLYFRSKASLRRRWEELPLNFADVWEGKWWARLPLLPVRILRGTIGLLAQLTLIIGLWLFMVTCGFGFKPGRVAFSVFCAPLLFASAYTLDDSLISGCAPFTPGLVKDSFYNAIANFTNQGHAPSLCGHFSGALTSLESIAGYFLLSILAAMLFVWLTDR